VKVILPVGVICVCFAAASSAWRLASSSALRLASAAWVNQKLSEQRAESVRGYLIEQGLAQTSVMARASASPRLSSIIRLPQTSKRIAEWKLWSQAK